MELCVLFVLIGLLGFGHADKQSYLNYRLRADAYWGNLNTVKSDISKGADVNSKTERRTTALMWASQNGHLKVVKYLIEKGANFNAKDVVGRTAEDYASRNGHPEVAEFLRNINMAKEMAKDMAREMFGETAKERTAVRERRINDLTAQNNGNVTVPSKLPNADMRAISNQE